MCLDRKGRFKPCKVGYKVMIRNGSQLVGYWRNISKERKLGVWLSELDFRNSDESSPDTLGTMFSGSHYPYGWHIYHSIEDVKVSYPSLTTAIVKVSVKNPVAVGYEGKLRRRVTVARQIKILEVIAR